MSVGIRGNNSPLVIDGYSFKKVEGFMYLGSFVNFSHSVSLEPDRRILAASRCY